MNYIISLRPGENAHALAAQLNESIPGCDAGFASEKGKPGRQREYTLGLFLCNGREVSVARGLLRDRGWMKIED